jgi:hypothetical protein
VFVPFAVPQARHGVAATFVGHPVLEECAWRGGQWHAAGSGDSAAALCKTPPGAGPLLCVLPGSRAQELARHMPLFGAPCYWAAACGARWAKQHAMRFCDAGDTVRLLRASLPALRLLLPTLPALRPTVAAGAAAWGVPHCVTDGADPASRHACFAATQ